MSCQYYNQQKTRKHSIEFNTKFKPRPKPFVIRTATAQTHVTNIINIHLQLLQFVLKICLSVLLATCHQCALILLETSAPQTVSRLMLQTSCLSMMEKCKN